MQIGRELAPEPMREASPNAVEPEREHPEALIDVRKVFADEDEAPEESCSISAAR